MAKVCVLQADSRPFLGYLLKTQRVNRLFCNILGYDYRFMRMKKTIVDYKTAKLYVVNHFLKTAKYDVLVFLDSDAWIQNGFWLNDVINNLVNNEKNGCYSRDPYVKKNTFINSGSFILKVNNYTKNMYTQMTNQLRHDIFHKVFNKYGWEDQFYISNYVFQHKDDFTIFVPSVLNTPKGEVLRHNWWKGKKMYMDLHRLFYDLLRKIYNKSTFIENDKYDDKEFPNKN